MQFARILFALTALAVIGQATPFRFPVRFPSFVTSLLPFTFNVTKDNTNLGSFTLNIKPKLRREFHTAKIKREVPTELPKPDEKIGRLNSKDSRLFSPLTERWQLGIPSGASLTAGSIASLAGIIWTIIAKNLEYKKEHGEFDWKDLKDGGKTKETVPSPPPAPSYGSYNAPSYGSDYSLPPHQKPEKGFDGFFKGSEGLKGMQAQAMKGLTRLVGLKDLNNLLHPDQKPKKLKWKKRPMQQQQYYAQPVYQSSYRQQEYPPQPQYAPPQEAPAYAPLPEYVPAPVYAPAPELAPVYAPAPEPAHVYAPEPAPVYAPEPAPIYAPEQAPVYPPAFEPAPVYAPPPVDATAQVNVPPPPPYVPPAQYSPTNNLHNSVPVFAPSSRGFPPQTNAQPWNNSPASAHQPDVSSPELQEPKTKTVAGSDDTASVSVAPFTQQPPPFMSIQTNGFLPIFPSAVDPLPFVPSSNQEETAQWPQSASDIPTFGVPPSPSSLSPLPPRRSRIEDSQQPLDPTLSVTEISKSQTSGPLIGTEDDGETQFEPEESLVAAEPSATLASILSNNTTSSM